MIAYCSNMKWNYSIFIFCKCILNNNRIIFYTNWFTPIKKFAFCLSYGDVSSETTDTDTPKAISEVFNPFII